MAQGIGSILREARNRRKVDLSSVESATRIRARFLRAIENEEWDVLPGGVYTRGFIRTYASYLGLDGERLAEDFRREVEGAPGERTSSPEPLPVAIPTANGTGARRRLLPPAGWIAVAAVLLIGVLAITLLPGGDGRSHGGADDKAARAGAGDDHRRSSNPQPTTVVRGVSVRLAANAEVWVCMLDGRGQRLVNGQILAAGAEEGPFRSGSFTVSFGNGEVSMLIDGKKAEIPVTASPIGYAIDASGTLTELDEAERPTCT